MMLLSLLLLVLIQYLTGAGIIRLTRYRPPQLQAMAMNMLLGMAVSSFIPFLLQLLFLPISLLSILVFHLVFLVALYIKRNSLPFRPQQFPVLRIRIYEIPSFIVLLLLVFISIWRCYYLPPTPRDLTSGPEVIAEYTVREKTMINSVFTVDLESTNNPYKPPYLTSLQIVYKYAGFPFGQVWLSLVFVSFTLLLYSLLSQYLHRILAGFLLIAFTAIPEMYGYTFMPLFDYPNAVYFFVSVWLLSRYMDAQENSFALSAIAMGIAAYIRSETLLIAIFLLPLLFFRLVKSGSPLWNALLKGLIFLLPAAIAVILTTLLYNGFYLPADYQVAGLLNPRLPDFPGLFRRIADILFVLVFSAEGIIYFGYFIFLFLAVVVLNLWWIRRHSATSLTMLYAVVLTFLGLAIAGHLFPLMDLEHSTKRGMFKLLPLMLMYMATAPGLLRKGCLVV